MKTVGIRDLEAHLSAYLRDVTRGERLLVTDRGRVVAELRQPDAAERSGLPEQRLHEERQSWTDAERREQVERVGEELIEKLGLRRLARQAKRPIRKVS
jgi:antitoxin (DNA-binding transcriptional repressor) of toxin-antitoxin stability system